MRAFAIAIAFSAVILAQQNAVEESRPEDQCSVEGTVYSATTREPLRKVQITMRYAEGRSRSGVSYAATSDASGRYVIDGLPPGRYMANAAKNGYVVAGYGQKRPSQSPTPLTLERAAHLKDINFRMTPQAVISGRVVDEDNEGVPGIAIHLIAESYSQGKKTRSLSDDAQTDDRGLYRMYGVAPGRYYVMAVQGSDYMQQREIMSNDPGTYLPVYYPNSVGQTAGASQITATAGSEIRGIDFQLRRAHAVHISGRLGGMPEKGQNTVTVMLMPRGSEEYGWESTRHEQADARGRFTFQNVAPGSYIIVAQMPGERNPRMAMRPVDVGDANVDGLVLNFVPPPDVPGVIKTEGFDLKGLGLRVFLQPAAFGEIVFGNTASEVADDGTFKLHGVAPGRYRLAASPLPDDAYVRAVAVSGTVVPDGIVDFSSGAGGQLTVVLSGKAAQIEGRVRSGDAAVPGATVVLVPDQRDNYELYVSAQSDQKGNFTLKGIRPGSYKLLALDDTDSGAWDDPDFLRPFEPKAEPVVVREGDKLARDLNLIVTEPAPAPAPRP